MFDKLEELVGRLEEINMMLTEPEVINDQKKYRELMRSRTNLLLSLKSTRNTRLQKME